MTGNYDRIARFYDPLSRLVFFNAQRNAQKNQLKFINGDQQLLIVGGGTGWILEAIGKSHSGLEITFVEISAKMIDMARRKDAGNNVVHFVHAAAEEFQSEITYDLLITAFLFDNFGTEKAGQVFYKLDALLKPGGLWLFSDFYLNQHKPGIWQRILLKSMYVFFRTIAQVEAKTLPDTEGLFQAAGYCQQAVSMHYNGFIKAIVYRKAPLK
ncbi:ubiquinone/menaquinone biosynthesis methylase [Pedobacter sp. BAL39]|uniref:class I SAM-dependent methyltransferase n=1 Tax=Pedobacter sp. BAL39 TaxID=391596 RepID=UPI0001559623|nr:class I SAM-dependent methyltransferase [Pedobacter sp. BAL39]EDM36901.1 ubiquinone/menaquinone biosynthesis methylase [Pedobacter sp. BAL39]